MSRYIDADLISRQDAIDALERIFNRCEEIETHLPDGDPDKTGYKMFPDYMIVWKYLRQLPSAQQWIPCSERMPEPSEDGKSFLVTASEIRSYNTNGDFYKKEDRRVTIEQFFFVDGYAHFFRAWYDKSKIIAWMPLVEPFNEGKMETEKLSRCPKCGEYTSVKSGACEYCGARMDERREAGNE